MPSLPTADRCYGCGACENICPKQCIAMQNLPTGELRPVVDAARCIECKKCMKICPALSTPELCLPQKVFAMTMRDPEQKRGSASGGAAHLFYQKALRDGAIVYGCEFDENHILKMRQAEQGSAIEPFRGSKYTFCRMETSYRDIRDQLNNGRRVLFIGTSCQVWGLKCFLGKTYENLLTVDLICHGVPPETYLREYLAYQEKRLGKKIDAVTFRGDTKENDFHIWLWSKGMPLYGRFAREDLFFAGFVNYIIFEEKCYSCPFASAYRVADLSIGDWGGPTNLKGQKLSLVFVNTAAAQNWVEELRNESDSEWEPHTVEQAVQSNEQLQGPSIKPKEYEQMREAYRESGYISMAQQYIAPYIRRYRQKKRREKQRWVIGLPLRALRKIKRKVFNS